ncbi:armadillo-type protein [Cladochytrium replicatum]|nr:armadillo-type protein [Cladochytrium replicatum]
MDSGHHRSRTYDSRGRGRRNDDEEANASPQDRIRRPILLVCDDAETPEQYKRYLNELVNSFIHDCEDYDTKAILIETLLLCISELPMKTSVYGTLSGILNAKNFDLGAEIVGAASDQLEEALRNGNWIKVKLLLRFFGELLNSNVIFPDTFIKLIDDLLTSLNDGATKPLLADVVVHSVLGSLPWVGATLWERSNESFSRILSQLETYVNARAHTARAPLSALSPYRGASEKTPYPQEDPINYLWSIVVHLKDDHWTAYILNRPWVQFEDVLAHALQHELRSFTLPEHEVALPFLPPAFWILDDEVIEAEFKLPPIHHVARYILSDTIADLIDFMSHNHTELATRYLQEGKLAVFYNLDWIQEEKYVLTAAIVEATFSEILKLPSSRQRPVFYAHLLFDLMPNPKAQKMIGRCIKTLVSRMDSDVPVGGMDLECVKRFTEWMALHLSNFKFQYKWDNWVDFVKLDPKSTRYSFVREVLERCVRLAYWQRVSEVLPDALKSEAEIFLPEPGPTQMIESRVKSDEAFLNIVDSLKDAMQKKQPSNVVESMLDRLHEYVKQVKKAEAENGTEMAVDGGTDPYITSVESDTVVREVFMEIVLTNGSKSFSHALNVIERYLSLLQTYSATRDAKIDIVRTVGSYWEKNTQFLEIMIDKLVNYRVVDSYSVVSWALSMEVLSAHCTRFFLWNVVLNTVHKLNNKVGHLNAKYVEKQKQVQSNQMDEMEDAATNEQDEAALRHYENTLSAAKKEQRDVYVLVFEKLAAFLVEYGRQMEETGADPSVTGTWRWVAGLMLAFGRTFGHDIKDLQVTIETIVFSSEAEMPYNIWGLWQELAQMYDLLK